MNRLTNNLIKKGILKTDSIIDAFAEIGRAEFIPREMIKEAEVDIPLPIGFGQTISQPTTVATMLELLDVRRGQNVLDVGSGSGWTTVLMAHIVGSGGHVTALERIPELCDMSRLNFEKFDFLKKHPIDFRCIDAIDGFKDNAPYDRILVSAEVQEIPRSFKEQLKIGGKIVIPVNNSLCYGEKRSKSDFYEENFPGFAFVPFVVKTQ